MFPMGFIGICRLGVRKVIFGGFDKKLNFYSTFFLRILCWFRILNKIYKNMPVWWGVKVRVNNITIILFNNIMILWKAALLRSNAKLGKALDIRVPIFLTKHITVFYYSFLSIEKTVICFVKKKWAVQGVGSMKSQNINPISFFFPKIRHPVLSEK